jgi:colanic acid/amylovoran biosynthesis glycosyltransferase
MSARRRHLGYVLKRFPRLSETFIAAELVELERQGERVTVFAVSRPEEPCAHAFLRELLAPVVYLPHRPLREPLRVAMALLRVIRADPRGWIRAARVALWPLHLKGVRRLLQATVLREEMGRAGVHHAHAHFASTAARLANLAWRMGGPRYSVTAHAKDIYHRQIRVDRLREKLVHASFVATVTSANRQYLESLLGIDGRVHIVSNSVDLRRIDSTGERSPQPGLVVSVARLVEKKGLADLIEACGLLERRGVAVRLEIVGDGPLRRALERVAARLGAPVMFRGSLPHEQVLHLYREAHVFSLPCVIASTGDRDGLPTSVLEAMAAGVPVVTTPLNGLAEAVEHELTGLVVPERDPIALAGALQRLLADPVLAARLAEAGRRRVESRFALERSVATLRALLPEAA